MADEEFGERVCRVAAGIYPVRVTTAGVIETLGLPPTQRLARMVGVALRDNGWTVVHPHTDPETGDKVPRSYLPDTPRPLYDAATESLEVVEGLILGTRFIRWAPLSLENFPMCKQFTSGKSNKCERNGVRCPLGEKPSPGRSCPALSGIASAAGYDGADLEYREGLKGLADKLDRVLSRYYTTGD